MWKALKVPELHRALLYFTLSVIIIPSYADYMYYYCINIVGFSKMDMSLFGMLEFFTLFVGVAIFNTFFKEKEIRYLLINANVINCIGSIGGIMFVLGKTMGLSPYVFVVLTSLIFDTVSTSLAFLPGMVIFAKLIPESIETSMFSLLVGITNAAMMVSKFTGNFCNLFVGVSTDNLDEFWKLLVTQTVLSLIPIGLVWLLPTRAKVRAI